MSKEISRNEANERVLQNGMDVGGTDKRDAYLSTVSDFMRPAQDYVTRNAFDGLWARPGLEWRDRSMVVMSILAATGMTNQLTSHVRGGLRNGLTEEEIREVMMMVMGYTGFPRGLEAMKAAETAIKAAREEKAKS